MVVARTTFLLLILSLGQPALSEGKLEWVSDSSGVSPIYEIGSQRYTLSLLANGTIYYSHQDGSLREPPHAVIQEIYRRRNEERKQGANLSFHRKLFLNNSFYQTLTLEPNKLSETILVIENGSVFQKNVLTGEKKPIVSLADGKLAIEEKFIENGRPVTVYRALNANVRDDLVAKYRGAKQASFDKITNHPENQPTKTPRPSVNLIAKQVNPSNPKNQNQNSIPGTSSNHATIRDSLNQNTRPVSQRPSWVGNKANQISAYIRRIREVPEPKNVDYFPIGLSGQYTRIRNDLNHSLWEIETMLAIGTTDEALDTQMREATRLSDDLHREWAHWLEDKAETKLNTDELRTRYKKDLHDFGEVSLIFRYNLLWNAAHDAKVNGVSAQEEKELELRAANSLLADLSDDPRVARLTNQRLMEWSEHRPELKRFLAQKSLETILPSSWFGRKTQTPILINSIK